MVGKGSPPRGRGKGFCGLVIAPGVRITPAWAGKGVVEGSHVEVNGITPAWAGKSGSRQRYRSKTWDHPRVGGEKVLQVTRSAEDVGSPPRGRGKGGFKTMFVAISRITPAWAGKSGSSAAVRSGAWDHPRMGGEKKAFSIGTRGLSESPPRGRGKESLLDRYPGVIGITPAWAGKSSLPSASRSMAWDHPRVGGEKSLHSGQ